jgi:hypothetical protein
MVTMDVTIAGENNAVTTAVKVDEGNHPWQ